jgi:peroxiredoxin/glutaredoxin
MKENREGQRVPNVNFRVRDAEGNWSTVTTQDLFANKKVVVFALPGAFTPTCSSSHLPRYNMLADEFAAAGVDDILCVSVNDTFVMNAWKADQDADRITFVPDGNGEFSKGMGMLVDKDELGFGARSWRYSMLVDDGVIEKMFIEEERPGDPFDVSDADTMLKYVGGTAKPDILLFTKPGCVHCARAKRILSEAGLPYAELPTNPRVLRALPGARTTPQVFVDGKHVGTADDLAAWLTARQAK